MTPKNLISAILVAFVVIVLFNNKEEASFWFFGEIKTSKLIILSIFFIFGLICGGFLFRRRKKIPKQETYKLSDENQDVHSETEEQDSVVSKLSDEDRDFINNK